MTEYQSKRKLPSDHHLLQSREEDSSESERRRNRRGSRTVDASTRQTPEGLSRPSTSQSRDYHHQPTSFSRVELPRQSSQDYHEGSILVKFLPKECSTPGKAVIGHHLPLSSPNSSSSSIKTVVNNEDKHPEQQESSLIVVEKKAVTLLPETLDKPTTQLQSKSNNIVSYSAVNLVSNFRSRLLRGIRRHQRRPSSDSMEDELIQKPLKQGSGLRSSYGAVMSSEDEEDNKQLQQQQDMQSSIIVGNTDNISSTKHAMFHHSTPHDASETPEVESSSRRRRKSLSDASGHPLAPGRHQHRRRSSTYRRSVSNEGRRASSGRRASHLSHREEDYSTEQLEIERFSVRPALTWFFLTGRKFLVKYWIWMVALMLMIMSVLGEKVVVFRICYMALFLTFILTFQLSYRFWRRFLFPFLIVVMVYSFVVLIAVYTYQFATIRDYWQTKLGIKPKLQEDLGLKKISNALPLFVELLTPTLFLLITFVQLRSFHKEFMELTRDDDVSSSSQGNYSTRRTTLQESTTTGTITSPNITPAGSSKKKAKKKGKKAVTEEGEDHEEASNANNEVKIDMELEESNEVFSEHVEPNEDKIIFDKTNLEKVEESAAKVTLRRKTEPPSPLVIGSPRMSERSVEFAAQDKLSPTSKRTSTVHRESSFSKSSLRRKTVSDITQVKLADVSLETAARDIRDRASTLWDTAKPGINELWELCWRFLEIHMMKAVFISAFYVAIKDISAVNFVFVFFTSIALPLARYEKLVTTIFAIWSASLILSKMMYQLSVASYFKHDDNCTYVYFAQFPDTPDYPPFNNMTQMDYRSYLGFGEVSNIFQHIGKYLLILLVLTVNSVVTLRQRIHRQRFGLASNPSKLLFMDGSRKNADQGLWHSVKFLCNYTFYKFGIEMTILSIIILIGSRMDVMSFVFSFWLFLIALLRRKTVQCLWPFFTLFVTTVVPIQYLLSLGIPSVLCMEYPWFNYIDPELRNWLFLPDFRIRPEGSKIFYDFVVLLLACRQWIVFNTESLMSLPVAASGGGSNAETFYNANDPSKRLKENVPDFFSSGKSFLDHIKSYFFSCFYWITLAVVFLTATGRSNLFGLGYILGCFFFLWNGSEFYLKPIRSIVRTWKCIIAYCALVIFLKTLLHVVGCVKSDFLLGSSYCWISKLVGISCENKLIRDTMTGSIKYASVENQGCTFTERASGIFWDGVCFCFLLIQKRIFGSYYFTFLIKDIKAQQVLASRGAELIHEIQAKEVMEQKEGEKDVMKKIKAKMDRIRAHQQEINAGGDSNRLPPERKSHRQAVRSGDYYLFDDPDAEDADLDLEEKPRKCLIPDPEGDELRRIANLRGISAFMSQLLKGELEPDGRDEPPLDRSEYTTDIGESSKDSAIISVDREQSEPVDPDASMVTIITTVPFTEVPSEKPSTSKSEDIADDFSKKKKKSDDDHEEADHEEDEGEDAPKIKISFWVRILHWFTIVCWFFESLVISMTAKLNHVSRDYRYVSRRLAVEKRALKLMFEIEESEGVNYGTEWKRTTLEKISRATVPRNASSDSIKRSRRAPTNQIELMAASSSRHTEPPQLKLEGQPHQVEDEEDSDESVALINSNAFVRLFRSLFYTVVSQSEYACYAMVIFNQMANASLLSLPLPIMVFLWGCMSVPRPTKTFWISLITYTEAVVVAKYIANFSVWPWVDYSEWKPQVVKGEDSTKMTALSTHFDLTLLLFLFFHRFMLKSLGLWDLDDSMEKSDRLSTDKTLEEDDEAVSKQYPKVKRISKKKGKKVDGKSEDKTVEVTADVEPQPNGTSRTESARKDIRKRNVIISTRDPPEDRIAVVESSQSSTSKSSRSPSDDYTSGSESEDEGLCPEEKSRVLAAFRSLYEILEEAKKPISKFYDRLLDPNLPFRISHDLYTLMFVCDFVNFFIVVFAFNAFGSSTGESITKYFEDNKVPVPFLMMIITQFCSMVIDRALYLRKNIHLRLYFHVVLVLVIHVWLFFILPSVTEKQFSKLNPPKFWYFFKCVYLLLSAVQVKGGYPTRILGNTFTKKYSYINLYFFKGYMLVPFLYDLRLIMDWIWTDTSLELDEWSIMEDIFKNLFQRKCELQFQASFPQFRGYPRPMYTKYMLGGAYLIMIIGAIWFPLVLFAVGGTVGSPNRPTDVSVEMEILGYAPILSLTATKVNLTFLNETAFSNMINVYKSNKAAVAFLSNSGYYDYQDTSMVELNDSTPVWAISPRAREALIGNLKKENHDIRLRTSVKITRAKVKGQSMDAEVMRNYDFTLTEESKNQLAKILDETGEVNNSAQLKKAKLEKVFPNFLRVPEKGEPENIKALDRTMEDNGFRDIYVILNTTEKHKGIEWFQVEDLCARYNDPYIGFYRRDENDCNSVLIMLVNEKVFPGALGVISGYGILGLYTTFVFVVSRLIRGLFDDVSFKAIYSQMPNVDKVLQLCLDIYLVRESLEFTLEEDLYAKLLFLYRSPETLIKWTKQLEEDQFKKQNIVIPPREQSSP